MNVTEKILYLKQHDLDAKDNRTDFLNNKKGKTEVIGIWRYNAFLNKDPEIMMQLPMLSQMTSAIWPKIDIPNGSWL